MTVEEMRAIPGTGPQIEGAGGRGGERGGRGPGAARAARRPASRARCGRGRGGAGGQQQGSGYNTVFVGRRAISGPSGRGEGVGLLPGIALGRVFAAAADR